MASFGHVAVGLLAGRLHGGGSSSRDKPCSWATMLAFAALAVLPDADVLLVALGARDWGPMGHRGASHSFAVALAIGLLVGIVARRLRWPPMRTAIVATLAVASHGLLDSLAQGGRGLPLLWPLSHARFHAPWRIIPDAPRGLHLISHHGLAELAIEFVLFLPITMFAFWPHLAARLGKRPQPSLTVLSGGGQVPARAPAAVAPAVASAAVTAVASAAVAAVAPSTLVTASDPPVRSSG